MVSNEEDVFHGFFIVNIIFLSDKGGGSAGLVLPGGGENKGGLVVSEK